MKVKKIVLFITYSLILLLFVTTCDPGIDTSSGTDEIGTDTLNRGSRPCEIACYEAVAACHSNCGANASCHTACDDTCNYCLGYWTITKYGTSICDITSSKNYLTLHFTIYLKTTDTRGFRGCDNTIWPEKGTQYSSRTLESHSFWFWDGGDAEAWTAQKIAQYGMGIGCP